MSMRWASLSIVLCVCKGLGGRQTSGYQIDGGRGRGRAVRLGSMSRHKLAVAVVFNTAKALSYHVTKHLQLPHRKRERAGLWET